MLKPLLRTIPTFNGNVKLVCSLTDKKQIDHDTTTANIRTAQILPLSSWMRQDYIGANLVGSSWDSDLSKYYNKYKDIFFDAAFSYNNKEMAMLDMHHNMYGRNTDFEYGVKRISYIKSGGDTFCCFAPIYIDKVSDIPSYLAIDVVFSSKGYHIKKRLKVNIASDKVHSYIYRYLSTYLSKIDSNVVFMNPHLKSATYYGIDLKKGGITKVVNSTIKNIFKIQMPIQQFDWMIAKGFVDNEICMEQVIPIAVNFNPNDLLSDNERIQLRGCELGFSAKYYNSNEMPVDWYDFNFDYDEYTENIYKMDEYTGDLVRSVGHSANIMDEGFPALHDCRIQKFQFDNKLTATYSRWKLKYSDDDYPYITNLSWAFSNNQSNDYKYKEFPVSFTPLTAFATATRANGKYHYNLIYPLLDNMDIYKMYSPLSVDKYTHIIDNYCTNWFNMTDDVVAFVDKCIWRDVEDNRVYYNGILYDLINVYNQYNIPANKHVDKFGVFCYIDTSRIYDSTKMEDMVFADNVINNSGSADARSNMNTSSYFNLKGFINNSDNVEVFSIDGPKNANIQYNSIFTKLPKDTNPLTASDVLYVECTYELGMDYYEMNKYYKVTDDLITYCNTINAEFGLNNSQAATNPTSFAHSVLTSYFKSDTVDVRPYQSLIDTAAKVLTTYGLSLTNFNTLDNDSYSYRPFILGKYQIPLYKGLPLTSEEDMSTINTFGDWSTYSIGERLGNQVHDNSIYYLSIQDKDKAELAYHLLIDNDSNDVVQIVNVKYNDKNVLPWNDKSGSSYFRYDRGRQTYMQLGDASYMEYSYPATGIHEDDLKNIKLSSGVINIDNLYGTHCNMLYYKDYFIHKNFANALCSTPDTVSTANVLDTMGITPDKVDPNDWVDLVAQYEATYIGPNGILSLYIDGLKHWVSDKIQAYLTSHDFPEYEYHPYLDFQRTHYTDNVFVERTNTTGRLYNSHTSLENISKDNNVLYVSKYNINALWKKYNDRWQNYEITKDAKKNEDFITMTKKISSKSIKRYNNKEYVLASEISSINGIAYSKEIQAAAKYIVDNYTETDLAVAATYIGIDGKTYKYNYIPMDALYSYYGNLDKEKVNLCDPNCKDKDKIHYRKFFGVVPSKEYLSAFFKELGKNEDYKFDADWENTWYDKLFVQQKVLMNTKDGVKAKYVYQKIKDFLINDDTVGTFSSFSKFYTMLEYDNTYRAFTVSDIYKNAVGKDRPLFNDSSLMTFDKDKKVLFNIYIYDDYYRVDDFINSVMGGLFDNAEEKAEMFKDFYVYRCMDTYEYDKKYFTIVNDGELKDAQVPIYRHIKYYDAQKTAELLNDESVIITDVDTALAAMYNDLYEQELEDTDIYEAFVLDEISKVTFGPITNYRYNTNNSTAMFAVSTEDLEALQKLDPEMYEKVKDHLYINYSNREKFSVDDVFDDDSVQLIETMESAGYEKVPEYIGSKLNVYKDTATNKIYGYYLINIKLDNTYNSFNMRGLSTDGTTSTSDDVENANLKYIQYINGVNIIDPKNVHYLSEAFKKILPFLYIQPLSSLAELNTLNKPYVFNLNVIYNESKIDNSVGTTPATELNLYIGDDNYIQQKIILQRYMNAIVPYITKRPSIGNLYNLKFKNVNENLIDQGIFNSIGDSVLYKKPASINSFTGFNIYTHSNDENVKGYNNVLYKHTPTEYKYYNASVAVNVPEEMSIPKAGKYTYEQLLELETYKNTIEEFAAKLKSYADFNPDEILFLYNKYNVEYDTKPVGLNFTKTEKLYTLTYKFTLI